MAFEIQQPVQPGPVNIGAAAQPLVTSAAPVVTPDAVTALTDAFHKGFITSQDIADRIGQIGQMERKTQMQKMSEFIDPAAIAARQQAVAAGGAQAGLVTAQAEAALPNVAQEAQVAKETAAQKLADIHHGTGASQAFSDYAQAYGVSTMPTLPDGSPDYETRAMLGREMAFTQQQIEIARQGMLPAGKKVAIPTKQGGTIEVEGNAFNQPLFDENGKQSAYAKDAARRYEYFTDQRDSARQRNATSTQTAPNAATSTAPATASPVTINLGPQAPTVMPGNPTNAASIPAATPMVQVPQTQAPVAASPAAATSVFPTYIPPGAIAAQNPNTFLEQKMATDLLDKDKGAERWQQSVSTLKTFFKAQESIKDAEATGKPLTGPEKTLGEAVFNLYAASAASAGGGRAMAPDFKLENLEAVGTIPDRVKNALGLILRKKALDPVAREAIITEGNDFAAGIEEGARAGVAPAAAVVKGAAGRVNPDAVFGAPGEPLRELAEGRSGIDAIKNRAGVTSATPAAAPANTVTLPTRGKGQYLGGGWWLPATNTPPAVTPK